MCWGVRKFPTKLILCPFNGLSEARSWALGEGVIAAWGRLPTSQPCGDSPAPHSVGIRLSWKLPGCRGWGGPRA